MSVPVSTAAGPGAEASAGSTADNGSKRAIRRRRSLPNGRAVVGGLLIALAAVGVYISYASAGTEATSELLVAAHELSPGDSISAADVERVTVGDISELAGAYFSTPDELEGAVVLGPVAPGELIQRGAVRLPSEAELAAGTQGRRFSLQLPAERALNGDLAPGELVDVVVTSGGPDSTEVVVRSALVVEVGDSDDASLPTESTVRLTLLMDDESDVLATIDAVTNAEVTLVATPVIDDENDLDPADGD
ncbi:MAG: hypothetical protein JJLCMIEE_00602 [Acidimicrobiales bacterium]|nr:MAG: hypothetical protein EDR02_16655 [Actinomycetota bacterium]MBV6507553.1 hypothetical protein [Acidimicrobiales bacterium]RIK07492.1 MAG: hypothetical protein DCC48_03035 [Acidobacteriota bacterium]